MESNNGLEFGQDTFMTIKKDGELVAIEQVNGVVHRWTTEKASRGKSLEIFGADKV